MANPVAHGSGTHDPAGTTEESVNTVNVAGTFQAVVSLENMADGDIAIIRLYRTLLAAGVRILLGEWAYYDAQLEDSWEGPYIANVNTTDADAIELTIESNDATVVFPWTMFKWV